MKFVIKATTPQEAVQECAALIEDLAEKWRSGKHTVDTTKVPGRLRFAEYDREADKMMSLAVLLRESVEVEEPPARDTTFDNHPLEM